MKTIFNRNFVSKTLCRSLFAISCEEFMAMQRVRLGDALCDGELLADLGISVDQAGLLEERAKENEIELFDVLDLLGDDLESLLDEYNFLVLFDKYVSQKNENFTDEKKEEAFIASLAEIACCELEYMKKELEQLF